MHHGLSALKYHPWEWMSWSHWAKFILGTESHWAILISNVAVNLAQTKIPINQKEQKGQMLCLQRSTPLETAAPSLAFSSQGSRWFLTHPAMMKAQRVKIKAEGWIPSLAELRVVPRTLVGMQKMEMSVKHNPEIYKGVCVTFTPGRVRERACAQKESWMHPTFTSPGPGRLLPMMNTLQEAAHLQVLFLLLLMSKQEAH